MKKRVLFFRHPACYHVAAVHLDDNYVLSVYVGVDGSCSIEITTGAYACEIQYESYLKGWKKSSSRKFYDKLTEAHERLLNTPYL